MFKRISRLELEEAQEALRSAEGKLPDHVYKLFQDVFTSYASLVNLLSDETMTVGRLRKMFRRRRRVQEAADVEEDTTRHTPTSGNGTPPIDT